jgi:ubiquinone/menaquinone biosynthesis C-methylase UbiE
MPDVYATIGEVDAATQERLAEILELRAADPQQKEMVQSYLSHLVLAPAARVLEIGCGTGPITRVLAQLTGVAEVVGIDPSPVFIARAGELAGPASNVTFEIGDGRALRFGDATFDAVVLHTTLCHVPQPELVIGEAARVLRPGAALAICDGDYSTITVALGDPDPLQACIEAVKTAFIHDPWVVRRVPALLRAAGFELLEARSHGYLQLSEPEYMLTVVDRGADVLATRAGGNQELAAALKAEARRRADAGEFYGFMGFTSFLARNSTG